MYSSPLKHFNKLETRNLSKTGMQSFQKVDNTNLVVYSLETLQSSHPPIPLSTPLVYERTKIMNEMPVTNSYPVPQKNGNGCLWATVIVLSVIVIFGCCLASVVVFYYSSEIAAGITRLVDFKTNTPIEVVPADSNPASPADETEYQNADPELDPTFRAFAYLPENACAFTGGVTKPWNDGPKNLNYVGIINQTTQESGFSQQAFMEYWTDQTIVAGYEFPFRKVEIGNDGGIQIEACKIDGQIYVFETDRSGESDVPFHQVSFTQLVGKKLLVCKNDTGKPGDWNGLCDDPTSYVYGVPIEDYAIPGDLIQAWNYMEEMLYDLPGNYRLPAYGEMLYFWVNQ